MTKIFLFLFLFFSGLFAGDAPWQGIQRQAKQYMVEIEYYEKVNTTDDLHNDTKRKHHLSGIVVSDSGLILTSNLIFKAGMDFTSAAHFTPPDPPSDIRVRFQDAQWQGASFVGKDDEAGIAFLKLKNSFKGKGIKFTNDTLKIGVQMLIVRMLKSNFRNRFLIQERKVNSIFENHHPKYLTELNANSAYGLGLVFDLHYRPIAIVKPSKNRFSFGGNFFSGSGGLAVIQPASAIASFIKHPPRFTRKKPGHKKWFGINMQPLTVAMAHYFGIADSGGILINTVLKKSPAQKAGLLPGDILLRFDGKKLTAQKNTDLDVFRTLVRNYKKQEAPIVFWRSGKAYHTQVHLTDIPISQYLANEVSDYWLGFSAKELTKDIILAQKLDFSIKGLWISRVERASMADLAGLRVGDILLKINNRELSALQPLKEELARLKKDKTSYIRLFVRQGPETKFIFISTKPQPLPR